MKLYVVRHAIALESAEGLADDARPLTREGRAQFSESVQGLQRLGVRLERLLHSPLLRAVQTAELLVPLLEGETRVSAALAQAPNSELLHALQGDSVAVVGHEPWLSELIALLVTGQRALGPRFALKKGAVAMLEGRPAPGEMSLIGFYPPQVLRGLAP